MMSDRSFNILSTLIILFAVVLASGCLNTNDKIGDRSADSTEYIIGYIVNDSETLADRSTITINDYEAGFSYITYDGVYYTNRYNITFTSRADNGTHTVLGTVTKPGNSTITPDMCTIILDGHREIIRDIDYRVAP